MAKIIVEEVQGGSGGTALTIPTAAATVNNQAVVGSTAGVLSHSPISLPAAASGANNRPLVGATTGATSFSPLALPAADGTANKLITTDGSGQLQFNPVAMPAADGAANSKLQTDGSGQASWAAAVAASTTPEDNILSVGMVISSSARMNVYSTGEWSSSGPNSTYYNSLTDASARTQAWNMMLADGYPDQTNGKFYADDYGSDYHRELIYAHNRRMGHYYRSLYYHDNASTGNDYAGVTFSCVPVRNHASSGSTNVAFKMYKSTGSGNYGGSGVMYYTATYSSGTTYGNATGGAWTVLNSHTSQDDNHNYSATVPVAAGTTVLVFMSSAHRYHTTYRYKDTHNYYDLHSTFTGDIKCDRRMLAALHSCRQPAAVYNASTPYEMYTSCASVYGDR